MAALSGTMSTSSAQLSMRITTAPPYRRAICWCSARVPFEPVKTSITALVVWKQAVAQKPFKDSRMRCRSIKCVPNLCRGGRSSHDAQIAAYIIQCAKSAFRAVVDREESVLSNACPGIATKFYHAARSSEWRRPEEDEAYFSHSYRTKQICDVCNFSVLNAHLCCVHCGIEVCPHCFDELKAGVARFAWKNLRCRSGTRHDESMFHLATFRLSFGAFKSVLVEVENQCRRYAIKNGAVCNGNHGRRRFQTEKCYCPRRSGEDEVTIEPICIIKDQMAADSYARFKAHLAVHHPVLVENVALHPKYRSELWSREAFATILARDKRLKILDSSSFGRAFVDGKRCTLEQFWQAFESRHDCSEPYLKVKDFPEGMRFVDVAPEQFKNLFEVLPFLEYTRASLKKNYSKGRLNLLNLMSGYAGAPDPGPKAYICCGLCNAPHLSSTPLHLDVSNAANFLPLVQTPRLMSHDEIAKALKKRLDIEAIEGSEQERVMRKPEKAGAIWKIFHPDDNGKIRDAIAEWKRIQGSKRREPGDAIHNQDMVVTPEMVQFFAQKGKCGNHVLLRGVVCYGHLYFTYFDILSYELNLPIGSEETFGHSSDVVHKEASTVAKRMQPQEVRKGKMLLPHPTLYSCWAIARNWLAVARGDWEIRLARLRITTTPFAVRMTNAR
uniref:JmjC domain-containing protein n=1 Tax=Ascaris lumbricoides TaxID=6252 RepID=A0A9J2P2Y4_ASCLU